MAQSGNDRTVISDATSLREVLARFQDPLPHIATWLIVTTILPLITLLVAMHAGLALGWWPLLAIGFPAAALTVRTAAIERVRRRAHRRPSRNEKAWSANAPQRLGEGHVRRMAVYAVKLQVQMHQVLWCVLGLSDKLVHRAGWELLCGPLVCTQGHARILEEGADMWGVPNSGFPC